MFQPDLRSTDGAGAVAVAAPSVAGAIAVPAPRRHKRRERARAQRRTAGRHADSELAVDLGRDIGSAHWWRGAITLVLLTSATLYMGARITALPTMPVPAYSPAEQIEASGLAIAPLSANSTTGRRIAPAQTVRPLAETPERPRIELTSRLARGGDLESTLRRAGVGQAEAKEAARLVSGAIAPSLINRNTEMDIVLGRRPDKTVARPLDSLKFRAAFDLRLALSRSADGSLQIKAIPIAVNAKPLRISGAVGGNLYRSARAAGVPAHIVSAYIKALSFGVDFQRDVGGNARFDMVFEHRLAETGEAETGKLLYAGLERGKRKLEMLRWTHGGREQFFDAKGVAIQKGLMRTPVDGARLSSGFGMRRHPILGYSRMHRGIDFAAASGTPILAAAAGRIEFAGWNKGYGKFVRINHGNGLATGYAHLRDFTVKAGQRVTQGQIIGRVGSTGMSTGPHLHYELYRNGQAVDPRSVKFTTQLQLAGGQLSAFKSQFNSLTAIKAGPKAIPGKKSGEAVAAVQSKADKPAG